MIWPPLPIHTHTHRYCHGVCQVQVCGEDKQGHKCGEVVCEHSRSFTRADFLFGDGCCCNLPGISDLHVLHISVMWRGTVWWSVFSHFLLSGNSSKSGSWCWSCSLLLIWDRLRHPPGCHIISGLSHQLLHWHLSGTSGLRHHCHCGMFSQYLSTQMIFMFCVCGPSPHFLSWSFSYHLCKLCEKNFTAHKQRWSGMFQFLSHGSN